jgi:hypothetical protein
MASYLDPRPSDCEIVEAIRFHYPIGVQRAMLSGHLRTIEETLDLLKRVEVMEMNEGIQRPHNQLQHQQQPNASRQNQHPGNDRRPPNPAAAEEKKKEVVEVGSRQKPHKGEGIT